MQVEKGVAGSKILYQLDFGPNVKYWATHKNLHIDVDIKIYIYLYGYKNLFTHYCEFKDKQ